jgi:dihydrolipoamide dehydrogenase
MVVGDVTTGTEVLVIGGGPGGYVATIRAGQLGLDVTLVEQDAYGGTCLNHGCIPSKALVSASDLAHRAGAAEDMGIHADPAADLSAMVGWKDRLVTRLTKGVESLCESAGATLVEGRAEFVSTDTARIVHEGDGQGSETIEFEHAVIATGSRPIQLPDLPFDGEPPSSPSSAARWSSSSSSPTPSPATRTT